MFVCGSLVLSIQYLVFRPDSYQVRGSVASVPLSLSRQYCRDDGYLKASGFLFKQAGGLPIIVTSGTLATVEPLIATCHPIAIGSLLVTHPINYSTYQLITPSLQFSCKRSLLLPTVSVSCHAGDWHLWLR